MSENEKPNMLVIGLILVLVTISVIIYVSQQLEVLDLSGQPEQVRTILEGVKIAFSSAAIAIGIGFSQNIALYATKWMRVQRTNEPANIEYSLKWMSETILKFEAVILAATPFVEIFAQNMPPRYRQVLVAGVGGFFAITLLVIREVKRVIEDVRKPVVAEPKPPT